MTRVSGGLRQVREAGQLVVEVAGRPVLVVYAGGALHAVQALCSHRGAPLADGTVIEGLLVCSWHRSAYRLADGSVAGGPAHCPLATFPVSIDGEDLLVLDEAR